MNCSYCAKEIGENANYFLLQSNEMSFCSLDCLTDWMLICGKLSIETNDESEGDENDIQE